MLKEKDSLLRKIEQLEKDLERSRKMVDITAFYWGSLTVKKDKWFDEKDVLSDHLIMTDVKDMSREELETELYFCNRNNKIEEIVNG